MADPSNTDKRASRAASEALTGSRKRTVARLVDEATGSTRRTGSPTSSTLLRRGPTADQARATETVGSSGERSFGPPIGRMREGQSTDSNQ